MVRVYATAAQIVALVGIPAASATDLRRASRDVDRILKGAVYTVDDDGYPTDADVRDLLAEMVAEQIAWYQELGDQTGIVAAGGGSIGSVTLPTITTSSPSDVILAPRAIQLARNSDLLEWRVYSC